MSREDSQFKLRMPADLRESIEEAAKDAKRSLNAEIVARLEISVVKDSVSDSLLSAEKARQLSDIARQSIPAAVKNRILKAVNQAVAMGHSSTNVKLTDLELDSMPEEDVNAMIEVLSSMLEESGYGYEWDGNDSVWIDF